MKFVASDPVRTLIRDEDWHQGSVMASPDIKIHLSLQRLQKEERNTKNMLSEVLCREKKKSSRGQGWDRSVSRRC